MMKTLTVLFAVHLALVSCADLPDYFPRCYRNDDDLENCLLNASEKLKPFLKIGLPEFNIPSIDPLVLDAVDVAQLGADYEYTCRTLNMTFENLTNYTFEELKFDPDSLTLHGRVTCPAISVKGKARLDGKMIVVHMNCDVDFAVVLGPVVTNFVIGGRLEKRENEDYFVPTKIKTRTSFADMYVSKCDMLNEDAYMSEITKMMLNANSKLIMSKVGIIFEQISDAVFPTYFKKFTTEVPYNKILPIR